MIINNNYNNNNNNNIADLGWPRTDSTLNCKQYNFFFNAPSSEVLILAKKEWEQLEKHLTTNKENNKMGTTASIWRSSPIQVLTAPDRA